ncbi:hypothetical protein R1sor_004104 [Riccia sorocarpa]|uniref:Protein kinase domain-containing protein n=1 Tax=Riccia sorocarpa TaxID=122646 RepID=A0ABD3H6C8_9MARC
MEGRLIALFAVILLLDPQVIVVSAEGLMSNVSLAFYWDRNENESSLAEACISGNYDILIVSHLDFFGTGETPLVSDIQSCQYHRRKVILSLGRDLSTYCLNSSEEAQDLARSSRADRYYSDLIKTLRILASQYYNKTFYITASSRSSFSDVKLGPGDGTALNAGVAMVFVQFYDSACDHPGRLNHLVSAWNQWTGNLASPHVQVFLGWPSSPNSNGSGDIDPKSLLRDILPSIYPKSNHGGVMRSGDSGHNYSYYRAKLRSVYVTTKFQVESTTSKVTVPASTPTATSNITVSPTPSLSPSGSSRNSPPVPPSHPPLSSFTPATSSLAPELLSPDSVFGDYPPFIVGSGDGNSHGGPNITAIAVGVVGGVAGLFIVMILLSCATHNEPHTVDAKPSANMQAPADGRIGPSKSGPAPNRYSASNGVLLSSQARIFSLSEVREVTDDFKTKIGQGGFGPVYYGKISEETEVAVKVNAGMSTQGLREFINEVSCLCRVHHRNLVSLLGYCQEEEERILVYEFMPKGTLREHLYGKGR